MFIRLSAVNMSMLSGNCRGFRHVIMVFFHFMIVTFFSLVVMLSLYFMTVLFFGFLFSFVPVVMLSLFRHHALQALLLISVHQIQQTDCMRTAILLFERGQNVLHPDIVFAARVNKQIAVLYHLDVLRGGLIGVNLLAGL